MLDEALAEGLFEVREVDDGGSVNEILVINKTNYTVLLLDGEILAGAKQNRVLNAGVPIGPGTFYADQGAIWLKGYKEAFSAVEDQIGAVVFIKGTSLPRRLR